MTYNVIPFVRTAALATIPTTSTPDTIARQQAIENALSAALHHIRKPHSTASLQSATSRAIRAASMLKQACTEANVSEVAA